MADNFSINTNFNTGSFENSINEFNKSLSLNSPNYIDDGSFENVFNSVGEKNKIKGGVNYVQKNKNTLSPTAKMAQDIASGFSNSIKELNTVDKKAQDDFETFASGGDISVHEVMISAQKSSLAMQMAIQLRNQMLSAYNEFKNLQI